MGKGIFGEKGKVGSIWSADVHGMSFEEGLSASGLRYASVRYVVHDGEDAYLVWYPIYFTEKSEYDRNVWLEKRTKHRPQDFDAFFHMTQRRDFKERIPVRVILEGTENYGFKIIEEIFDGKKEFEK